ncbi:hypothetical protein A9Q84_03215 [Halobacteriovorax marinus]|uniref:Secreted protein n=1 Tax=Halobacteriovorax marinus TaxID=97084 RepID=A0A1Y5FDA1_9BACT|nr:hypothetical protein A9Q84_03215 [Halobacteriovorax marinus]
MPIKLLSLILILAFSTSHSMAEDSEFQAIKDTVKKVGVLKEVSKGPNAIDYSCHDCIKELDIERAVVLDSDEVTTDRQMFHLGKKDNRMVIKRDKNTPDKVTINFTEKYRTCLKTIAYQNPLSGQIGFGCRFHSYETREDSITIDFSDRKLEGESEYIEIEFIKLDVDNKGYINTRFREQTGKRISADKGSKFMFFGTKYSLK